MKRDQEAVMSAAVKRMVSAALCAAFLCVSALLALPGTAGAVSDTPRGGAWPVVGIGAPVYGNAATAALGNDLRAVALAHGLTEAQLRARFAADQSLGVDAGGRLLFADPELPAAPAGASLFDASSGPAALEPLQNTFLLHSRPGAKRIIYLDFDGFTLHNTAWNNFKATNGGRDIVCPPWDIEGGPSVFTDTERTRIQEVWQRVSEDYAPFDVDVTTEYTGEAAITRSSSTDEYYGMRVLISPISSKFGQYGGIAYIGVFNMVGDTYKPALVFPENLANGAKYIAEAASHENGHTLGLSHDGIKYVTVYYAGHGSGETGWAPIMGNGYYQNLTEWSKGEYPGANNTENDLAVITAHGIGYRPDDYGSSLATATALPTGANPSIRGAIGTTGDVDVFALNAGAGALSLAVAPAVLGADLDVLLELRNSAGTVVASNNPTYLLAASLTTTVSAGTYYVSVKGTGKGDLATGYSDYGVLGAYTLSAQLVDPGGSNRSPVAVATGTPTSGLAPLVVGFDGSGSSDPDGTITTYSWEFGDGSAVVGSVTPSHTYTSPGDYTATLTVTDDDGAAASTSVSISVLLAGGNIAPIAVATASPASGAAPLSVTLDGSGSTDADGLIVTYAWDFGDGSKGSGSKVTHVYSKIGTYTAVLTVTDAEGATDTGSVSISATGNPAMVLRVTSISLASSFVRGRKVVRATAKVTNLNGTAVTGVTVRGAWSGLVSGSTSKSTTTGGSAVFNSPYFTKSGVVTFTITGLTKSGYTYDATKNVVTSASITVR